MYSLLIYWVHYFLLLLLRFFTKLRVFCNLFFSIDTTVLLMMTMMRTAKMGRAMTTTTTTTKKKIHVEY